MANMYALLAWVAQSIGLLAFMSAFLMIIGLCAVAAQQGPVRRSRPDAIPRGLIP